MGLLVINIGKYRKFVIKSPCPEEAFLFSIILLRMPIYSIIHLKCVYTILLGVACKQDLGLVNNDCWKC